MNARELVDCARRRIARAVRDPDDVPRQLGEVTLHEEQWMAARRAAEIVRRQGGVLVANDVGSGKTFVALAAAQPFGHVTVVAPATLRASWERALSRTAVEANVLGLESLSRRSVEPTFPAATGVVIVDESHHLRNPATRRYAAAAALCARARVILLSATPVQNRRADVAAQLALFLGERAWTLSDGALASFVVRSAATQAGTRLPDVSGPHRVELARDDDWLDELLALPPPLAPADGGDGGALLAYTLVRRWASSLAALVASLERRLATALAIESALESGRWPTRAELSAWNVADNAMQLAFPELTAAPSSGGPVAPFLDVVRLHVDGVKALLHRVRGGRDPDTARVEAIRAIRGAHPREIVIAFSEYAETVAALGRRLAPDGGVAWLTSRGGHTATDTIARRDILAQLAPGANSVPLAERISLLVTTDVLSEGLDLQCASVVVHLDFPWNPARLEQRVGRARRLGSRHAVVTVYALAPPASSDRLIRVEQRLREKIQVAARSVGVAGRILPPVFDLDATPHAPSVAESRADVLQLVRGWESREEDSRPRDRVDWTAFNPPFPPEPTIAAVAAELDGVLAALEDDGRAVLVADVGDGLTTDARVVLRAVVAAGGAPMDPPRARHADALRSLRAWWDLHRGAAALDLRPRTPASVRGRALARLASIAARAPRYQRPGVVSQVELARSAVMATLSAGSERVLGTLVGASLPDDAWLRALAAFAETHAPARPEGAEIASRATEALPLLAAILLVFTGGARPARAGVASEARRERDTPLGSPA